MINPPTSQNQQNGLPRFNSIKNAIKGTMPGIKTMTTRSHAKNKLRIVIIGFNVRSNAPLSFQYLPCHPCFWCIVMTFVWPYNYAKMAGNSYLWHQPRSIQ